MANQNLAPIIMSSYTNCMNSFVYLSVLTQIPPSHVRFPADFTFKTLLAGVYNHMPC